MILVIDNYDSFTYNLVQYVGALGEKPVVRTNDELVVEDVGPMNPGGIIIGSGAGLPQRAGVSIALIQRWAGHVPILGVGLGHQCVAEAFGASIAQGVEPVHGKAETIDHDGKGLFAGLHLPFAGTRYDSAVVDATRLPPELHVSARFEGGEVAGLRHTSLAIEAVQFDPASVLTMHGQQIIQNFLAMTKTVRAA